MTTVAERSVIEALEPSRVWKLFAAMAEVPRPSKHEELIRAHIRETAASLGLACREDTIGNLVIDVPASPGREQAPITVLQGHLDMVGDKNAGVEHDFERDPIRLVLDEDPETREAIVRADGTTLGADNGVGVAMALAVATDPDVTHGPLEILCTLDEEMGMTGAKALEADFFKGRRLLNLDSEEDDQLYIGCAGGTDVTLTWTMPLKPLSKDEACCRISVSGLRGGHSGGDIHLNRANAIKLLAQTLHDAGVEQLRLVTLHGGSKRNAIPREAEAVVVGPEGALEALRRAVEVAREACVRLNGESGCSISLTPLETADITGAVSASDTRRILAGLVALPSGVLTMVPEIPGLVQTSSNLSTIASEPATDDRIAVVAGCLTRSSSADDIRRAVAQVSAVGGLAGAEVEAGNAYPGWQPDVDSALLKTCRSVYEGLFGEEPAVTAIHAGLECGIIAERAGKMDMISFGPCIRGAHSPDERVYVDSVARSYRFLISVLGELARA